MTLKCGEYVKYGVLFMSKINMICCKGFSMLCNYPFFINDIVHNSPAKIDKYCSYQNATIGCQPYLFTFFNGEVNKQQMFDS